MNERIAKLREKIAGRTPEIDSERAVLYTRSWQSTEGEPIQMRRAKAFREILENQTVFIEQGLTNLRDPEVGQCQVGSLTGAVASERVSEALKGSLRMVGNHSKSAKAEGSLTARPTGRAGTKVGLSDPVVESGIAIAFGTALRTVPSTSVQFRRGIEVLKEKFSISDSIFFKVLCNIFNSSFVGTSSVTFNLSSLI